MLRYDGVLFMLCAGGPFGRGALAQILTRVEQTSHGGAERPI